jgi:sortase B
MKKKRTLKLKYKKILLNVAMINCIILFGLTFFPVGKKIYYERKSNQVQEIILDSVIKIEKTDGFEKKVIDFAKLKALNPDVVGWIEIPNTNIDYAIVKGYDNSYYLNHDTLKKYNIYGSIFMHYQNDPTFQDNNTILFGHNTYKDTLFAELIKIYEGTLGNDIKITIYTETEKIEYQVYASYITKEEDETPLNIHTNYFSKNQSNFQNNSPVSQTLTLSTCYKDDTKRIIVHAKRLNGKET